MLHGWRLKVRLRNQLLSSCLPAPVAPNSVQLSPSCFPVAAAAKLPPNYRPATVQLPPSYHPTTAQFLPNCPQFLPSDGFATGQIPEVTA